MVVAAAPTSTISALREHECVNVEHKCVNVEHKCANIEHECVNIEHKCVNIEHKCVNSGLRLDELNNANHALLEYTVLL